jgi:hypothetical protein
MAGWKGFLPVGKGCTSPAIPGYPPADADAAFPGKSNQISGYKASSGSVLKKAPKKPVQNQFSNWDALWWYTP